ncbi:dihydropteroate synthase [Acidomonas methanolica]|nr:dihydropteroate synthase [Acidomonas methanolica]TCS31344.1 dihydropteroate synthase [Acidomonas methanolica]GBQ56320.1 dihydropteroate synthase [Acidomonas methanolica]
MSAMWEERRDLLWQRIWQAHRTRAPLVMGILNVTPDSFSDGGRFMGEAAAHQAARLAAEGAAIIDVGGESTRPGSQRLDEAEERRRIEPVLETIAGGGAPGLEIPLSDVPVSIDTYKAGTARAAVARGAVMVNDIGGLLGDPGMAEVIAESGALAVLMHNRHEADEQIDIFDDLRRVFDAALARGREAGIVRERMVLDPGIGFGKTHGQNLDCIAHLDRLRAAYELPVLLGLSRKSFLGRELGREVNERLGGTLGANLFGAARGAAILRVHDVAAHVDALRIQQALAARCG